MYKLLPSAGGSPPRPTTCPPIHSQGCLRSNRHFTFQALPGSVLKLETSCQKGKCCQGLTDTSWLIRFRPHGRAWRRTFCFDCFFITWSILGQFQFQFFLRLKEDSNKKNEYRHSIVGHFISLTAVLPQFQLLRLVRSLAVLLATVGL